VSGYSIGDRRPASARFCCRYRFSLPVEELEGGLDELAVVLEDPHQGCAGSPGGEGVDVAERAAVPQLVAESAAASSFRSTRFPVNPVAPSSTMRRVAMSLPRIST